MVTAMASSGPFPTTSMALASSAECAARGRSRDRLSREEGESKSVGQLSIHWRMNSRISLEMKGNNKVMSIYLSLYIYQMSMEVKEVCGLLTFEEIVLVWHPYPSL